MPIRLAAIAALTVLPAADAEAPSFRRDVMAVLAKAGCNQGACHGNLNGKGGFRLSLRGDDPPGDLRTLTRGMLGRRANPADPDASLLLQKATGRITHEGGSRFAADSLEYRLLRDWIAAGLPDDDAPELIGLNVTPAEKILVAPTDTVEIDVTARFADGSERDVRRLAVYEESEPGTVRVSPDGRVERLKDGEVVITVRYLDRQVPVRLALVPARPGFEWGEPTADSEIDRLVNHNLKARRMNPSPVADDATFLRRAYLDAVGLLPTVAEARRFLNDRSPAKRQRLIKGLLARPEFAEFWALKWSDLLRNEEKVLDAKGVRVFHKWMRDWFAADRPLNEFARELLAGRGSTYKSPPANYYRALRNPADRAEATAQVFLGTRIACARCHNHPFDRWKREEYHAFAALFSQVKYKVVKNQRKDRLDKHEFSGEQLVTIDRARQLKHPDTGKPVGPRLLGAAEVGMKADRLRALADWVAAADNPFFARAQANRVWYHIMGRGLVEPDDDFRASNPATNGPLLQYLTTQFRENGYRLKPLVRLIMSSRTYQRTWRATPTNAADRAQFSRAAVRPLQAEQLLDAVGGVLGVSARFQGYEAGTRAGELAALRFPARGAKRGPGGQFLKAFGRPDRLLNCDCERGKDAGLLQAFQMITGRLVHGMLGESDNRIGRLLAKGRPDAAMLDEFYLAALCRRPSEKERRGLLKYITDADDRRAAWEDVVWGLLNSKEFLLRR